MQRWNDEVHSKKSVDLSCWQYLAKYLCGILLTRAELFLTVKSCQGWPKPDFFTSKVFD